MRAVLLIDFGSTYTKVTAVDVESAALLGTASAYTTVRTDVGEGLAEALALLERGTGKLDFEKRLACSSAAGGLKMIACGLVPALTAKAARLAALGAGAKVTGVYAFQLTDEDVAEIVAGQPDMLLLCGGTDGGNSACILHNAGMLGRAKVPFPVVVAGNRSCAAKCVELLDCCAAYRCENVLPTLETLNIGPAQAMIRDIFLDRIVQAKGLSREQALLDGILMPTPGAVMAAMELLAEGADGEPGLGDLLGVDLGGATTDVYSIADGSPQQVNTIFKGLPEPYAKRTVEGDIGMRYSVDGIVQAAGIDRVTALSELTPERAEALAAWLGAHTDALPETDELQRLDYALASLAVECAVTRHAGRLEEVFTPTGRAFAQQGKDLTAVRRVVVTGGALIHAPRVGDIAAQALYSERDPMSLRPKQADILVDRHYILAAMGLLGQYAPAAALRILKRELIPAERR